MTKEAPKLTTNRHLAEAGVLHALSTTQETKGEMKRPVQEPPVTIMVHLTAEVATADQGQTGMVGVMKNRPDRSTVAGMELPGVAVVVKLPPIGAMTSLTREVQDLVLPEVAIGRVKTVGKIGVLLGEAVVEVLMPLPSLNGAMRMIMVRGDPDQDPEKEVKPVTNATNLVTLLVNVPTTVLAVVVAAAVASSVAKMDILQGNAQTLILDHLGEEEAEEET